MRCKHSSLCSCKAKHEGLRPVSLRQHTFRYPLSEKHWKGSAVHFDALRYFTELRVTSRLKSLEKLELECVYSFSSWFALGESCRPRANCTVVLGRGFSGLSAAGGISLQFLDHLRMCALSPYPEQNMPLMLSRRKSMTRIPTWHSTHWR